MNPENLENTFNTLSVVLENILNIKWPYVDYDDTQVICKFCMMSVLKVNVK